MKKLFAVIFVLCATWSAAAQSAHKPDNESRTVTQVSIDNDLSLNVTPGVYEVSGVLNFSCDPSAGVKIGFEETEGAEIQANFSPLNALFSDTTNEVATTGQLLQLGAVATEISGAEYYSVVIHGTIKVNASGKWSLVWAQRAQSNTPTELGRGSYLRLSPVN